MRQSPTRNRIIPLPALSLMLPTGLGFVSSKSNLAQIRLATCDGRLLTSLAAVDKMTTE